MRNIFKLLPYVRNQYPRLLTITLFSLIVSALGAYQPQIFKQIVDTVVEYGTNLQWSHVNQSLMLLFALSIVSILMSYGFNVASNRAFQQIRSQLRLQVFTQVTSLSTDYFDSNRPGAIIQKSNTSIGSFSQWINSLNYSLLGPIFTIVFITIILYLSDFWIGTLGLGIIIVSSLEFYLTRKRTRSANKKWRLHNETSVGIFTETIQNMNTIATLSSMDRFRKKMAEEETEVLKAAFKVRDTWQASGTRVSLFNELAFLTAVVIVVSQTMKGRFSAGEFVALTAYFNSLRGSARSFAQFIPETDQVENDAERLVELLETKPTFPDSPRAVPLNKLKSIEFKNVSFTYPDGKRGAVEGISFRIEQNRNVALVGPSGVGKSTITKLLLRFYPPTSGEILINDQSADTFTHESVRQHIGMVMQDVALFNTTVKENLKLAHAKASMADLISAAEQAHADEFINELPKQYKTLVGERGVKLSGGQKQRIAIARAILKNPDLIVLDEATSALDSQSEKLVQGGLKELRKNRMGLTIAHRISTVQHADEILVLKEGKIFERGTHTQLMAKNNGLYRKLFTLQSATGKVKL